jgi:hypothetical protein
MAEDVVPQGDPVTGSAVALLPVLTTISAVALALAALAPIASKGPKLPVGDRPSLILAGLLLVHILSIVGSVHCVAAMWEGSGLTLKDAFFERTDQPPASRRAGSALGYMALGIIVLVCTSLGIVAALIT